MGTPSFVIRLAGIGAIFFLGLIAITLALALGLGSFNPTRTRILLTLITLFLGSVFIWIQLRAWQRYAKNRISKLFVASVLAVVLSQTAFLLLVWTDLRTSMTVVKIWWATMVPSAALTHLLLLRSAEIGQRQPGLRRLADVLTILASIVILSLVFRSDPFSGMSPWYLYPALGILSLDFLLTVIFGTPRAYNLACAAYGKKRALTLLFVFTHLLIALGAFFLGQAQERLKTPVTENPAELLKEAGRTFRKALGDGAYQVQSRVAEYFGDTQIHNRPPFITLEQIKEVASRFQPGDIILERRNWFLSNPMLPGFWPHAALYIGSPEDLEKLGILKLPEVQKHLHAYQKGTEDGHQIRIIEAVSEGVIFNSLEHSIHADYVVALRPRLPAKQIALAITRAFGNLGKQYDFNFDFADRSKLVCTQVVWLSYEGLLDFPLVEVMGRQTLPAQQIALKFVQELNTVNQQLDFVFFLDAICPAAKAHLVGVSTFCASIKRPQAWVEGR